MPFNLPHPVQHCIPHFISCEFCHIASQYPAQSASLCRCLSVSYSSDCFLDLAHVSLQTLAYVATETEPLAKLCSKLPAFAQMSALTELRLQNVILNQELSSLQCLSLSELSLVRCTPKEVPQFLHLAFPRLVSLHIEEDKNIRKEWEHAEEQYLMNDSRKVNESREILYSLPWLCQLSGNTIVRVLAKQNMLRGLSLASSDDNECYWSYPLHRRLSNPGIQIWMR